MRVHLINEFVARGILVDLLIGSADSPYMGALHENVRVVNLGTSNAITSVPSLAWYLHRNRPDMVMTQRIRVNVAALRARRVLGSKTPIVSTINTNLTSQLESLKPEKKRKHLQMMRHYYPRNDGLIAVSCGVADDAAEVIGYPRERINTITNPVVTPALHEQAKQPVQHPWFEPGQPPVILGVGRLDPQKDFPTLLRAFARLRRERDCRLIILGEGRLRAELEGLAESLGIRADVDLPGFVTNPYAYMSRASLYTLSSAWEGSPNALTEALAVGVPVVATDCPNGPNEILEGGRYGLLVPVADDAALAQAMAQTLDNPLPRAVLQRAAARYTVENSATQYLACLGLA